MSDPRPGDAARAGAGNTGLDPRVASVVAYSAWWITGVLFLVVEKSDHQVRFHAAQSIVVFGTVSAVMAVAYGTALPLMLVSDGAARLVLTLADVTWLAAIALWAWLLVKAAKGEAWCVPGLAGTVTRLAGPPPAG